MFGLFLFLAFAALIIKLIVEIIRYFKVKANAFSRKEVKDMALQRANELSYEDPEITCDYCGCKFNTLQHKVCPNCGAAFHKDEEWVLRHGLEEDYVDETTDELIAAREEKAKVETEKILGRIKKTILAIVVMMGILLAFAVIGIMLQKKSEYRGDEKLNENDYDHYVEADYEVCGDGVIYDMDGVTITIKGIYTSDYIHEYKDREYPYDGRVRVAFQVDNRRDEDIRIALSCSGVNGVCESYGSISFYDTFKKNKSVTIYETFYSVPYLKLEEMAFDRLAITTLDYTYHVENETPSIVKTTVKNPYHADYTDRELIFSNEKVDIYGWYSISDSRSGYQFAIVNKSGEHLKVRKGDMKYDGGEGDELGIFYQVMLPKDYTLVSGVNYNYNNREADLTTQKVEVNFAIDCPMNPTLDFSTGYLDISQLDETMSVVEKY